MRSSFHVLAAALLFCTAVADDPSPFASEALRGIDQLLAPEESDFGASPPESMKDETGAPIQGDALRAFQRKDDGPWKTFQDDVISFEYPDDPLIRVVAITPEEEVRIVGGAVGTTDRSFQRAYRLLVGRRLPYLTIFARETDQFDNGICLCGPIAHEQWVLANGSLLQLSYLPSGALKKVQALGAKHRAIALEWTHTAITQEAFARIGRSLRLRQPGAGSRAEWMPRLTSDADPIDGAIWLEPKMTESAARDLLGEPTEKAPGLWTYIHELDYPDGSRWKLTKRIPFTDGRLAPLARGWRKNEELKPKPRSLRWVEKLVSRDGHPYPGIGGDEPESEPSKTDARAAAEIFLEQAQAKAGKEISDRWLRAMAVLFEMKLGDPRVLATVEASFLDTELDQAVALQLLQAAESPRFRDLCAERARLIFETAPARADELPELWEGMDATSPHARASHKVAQTHANPVFRAAAVKALTTLLAEEEAKKARFAALDDSDLQVRRAAADPMSWFHDMTADDLPLLRTHLAKETDPATKHALHNIVANLERQVKAGAR